jgi:hypothetical protein
MSWIHLPLDRDQWPGFFVHGNEPAGGFRKRREIS